MSAATAATAATPVVFWKPGENYFIRTVTFHLTGRFVGHDPAGDIVLTDAAWIPDDGRFMQAVASANFTECEPYPDGHLVIVNKDTIVDATTIPKLPREQK